MADDHEWMNCDCGQCPAWPERGGTSNGDDAGMVSEGEEGPKKHGLADDADVVQERAVTSAEGCDGDDIGIEELVRAVSNVRRRFSSMVPAPWLSATIDVLMLWVGGVAQQGASVLPQNGEDSENTHPSAAAAMYAFHSDEGKVAEVLAAAQHKLPEQFNPIALSGLVAIGLSMCDNSPYRSLMNVLPCKLLRQGLFALADPLKPSRKWLVDVSKLWETLEGKKRAHSCKRVHAVCEFLVALLHFMKSAECCPEYIRRISDMHWQLLVYGVSTDIRACSLLDMLRGVLRHVSDKIQQNCIHECNDLMVSHSMRPGGDINFLSAGQRTECSKWLADLAASTCKLSGVLRLYCIAGSMTQTSTNDARFEGASASNESGYNDSLVPGGGASLSPYATLSGTEAKDDEFASGSPPRSPSRKQPHLTVSVGEDVFGGGFTARVVSGWLNGEHVVLKLPRQKKSDVEVFNNGAEELEIIEHLHQNSGESHPHPSIVAAVGVSEIEGYGSCLVMEYGGMQLRALLDLRREFPLARGLLESVALDVAGAMAFVSAQGVVHRDLATRNVLVYSDNGKLRVRLADFGMAVRLQDGQDHCKVHGTRPEECAPEVRDNGLYSMKSDVYSFGVFLLDLFADVTKVSSLPWWFQHWTELIGRCVNENPKARPTFAEIVTQIEAIMEPNVAHETAEPHGTATEPHGTATEPHDTATEPHHTAAEMGQEDTSWDEFIDGTGDRR